MSFIDSIRSKIEGALKPSSFEIFNESHLHAGHQEKFDGSGETHLRLRIVSDAFIGKSRVDRHRMINELVSEEMSNGLHAIAIEAKAPGEFIG
jgi:BolA protein